MDTDEENDQNIFQEIARSNLNKISKNIKNIGYTDGITDGRESVFQSGFDNGYSDSYELSLNLKKYAIAAATILQNNKIDLTDDLKKELNILSKMDPRNKDHFKMLENLKDSIGQISEIQINYNKKMLVDLKNNFPLFHNLFIQ